MSNNEIYRSTMTYAVAIAGSERLLAERLGVKVPELVNWMMGVDQIPTDVFLSAVDVVLNATAEDIRRSREILIQRQSLPKKPGN